MFFSRRKNLVGLDIGSSAVKVVELKELGKGRGYQLLNLAPVCRAAASGTGGELPADCMKKMLAGQDALFREDFDQAEALTRQGIALKPGLLWIGSTRYAHPTPS